MKRNIFKLFLNKFLAYPIWVKQVVYYRLWQNMSENNCANYIINNSDGILSLHIPTLSFQGKQELWDKKGGFDSNLYNFLKYSHDGYTILEIALNMFLSIEEVSKLYLFCLEQGYIEKPERQEITAMAEFIAGKIKAGEYYIANGTLTNEQIEKALTMQKIFEEKGEHHLIGKVLTELGFIKEEDIKTLFKLKSDARKRFVINPEQLPNRDDDVRDYDKLEEENKQLKKENKALKKALSTILNTVKKYDI